MWREEAASTAPLRHFKTESFIIETVVLVTIVMAVAVLRPSHIRKWQNHPCVVPEAW